MLESKWANKYIVGRDGTRDEVCDKNEQDLRNNPILLNDLHEIDNKVLACWCDIKKERCHGETLIKLRKEQLNKKLYKLAVIGSRTINNKKIVFDYLDSKRDKIEMIISGGATGPDSISAEWCKERGYPILIFFPKWKNPDGSPLG